MNITLIGMPGAGKSFVGRQLAERLGFAFVELDRLIEAACGLALPQVLEILGDEAFLRHESAVAKANVIIPHGQVISPGGSIIYSEDAMAHLDDLTTVIYLRVPLEVIEARIGTTPRGIVGLRGRPLAELYAERTPRYERWSSVTVDGTRPPDEIVEAIVAQLHP